MKILNGLLLLFAALLAACGGGDSGPSPRVVALSEFHRAVAGHRVVEVAVPGADGARLATYVYLPAQGDGPFPTLVMRTPYDLPITPVSGFPEDHANAETEARAEDVGWTEATDRGYALVVQVMRGRLQSEGVFSLFLEDEVGDGEALIRWVERQPWSTSVPRSEAPASMSAASPARPCCTPASTSRGQSTTPPNTASSSARSSSTSPRSCAARTTS